MDCSGSSVKMSGTKGRNSHMDGPGASELKQSTWDKSVKKFLPCSFPGCNFQTPWPRSLYRHKKLHERMSGGGGVDKLISCPFPGCTYGSFRKDVVQRHQIRHQPASDAKFYFCPLFGCTFQTSWLRSLQRHKRKHEVMGGAAISGAATGGGSSSGGGKPISCPFPGCSYTSHRNDAVKRHAKRHHSNQPAPTTTTSTTTTTAAATNPSSKFYPCPFKSDQTNISKSHLGSEHQWM